MDLNWFESLILGIVTGLTEILPVSSEAHSRILLKFMGESRMHPLMSLLIHGAIGAALYISCAPHVLKMIRAKKLARIPKNKRKRPLDVRSLMDFSLLMTMLLPVVIVLVFYNKIRSLQVNSILMATFLFLNGLILYIPQFLPSSNKDCRSLSRVEGLLMGLGGALYVIPGFSGIGASASVASVCGVDHKYGIHMILLMELGVMIGHCLLDLTQLVSLGFSSVSLGLFGCSVLAGLFAFAVSYLAIRFVRFLAGGKGFGVFSFYCWGLALFAFVLTLMA